MRQKQILITGASRGIGFETACSLARNGHRVLAIARSKDALERLREQDETLITTITGDLSLVKDLDKVVDHLNKENVRLDGILHNAGRLVNKPFEKLTALDWSQMLNVNLMIPVHLTRRLLDRLNPSSHIVHISSMGGFQGSSKFPGLSAYSTTKGALGILTECLAVELSDRQVRVNCLCLGAVQTEMFEAAFPGLQAPVSSADMGEYIAGFALEGQKFYNGRILPVSLSDPG